MNDELDLVNQSKSNASMSNWLDSFVDKQVTQPVDAKTLDNCQGQKFALGFQIKTNQIGIQITPVSAEIKFSAGSQCAA